MCNKFSHILSFDCCSYIVVVVCAVSPSYPVGFDCMKLYNNWQASETLSGYINFSFIYKCTCAVIVVHALYYLMWVELVTAMTLVRDVDIFATTGNWPLK